MVPLRVVWSPTRSPCSSRYLQGSSREETYAAVGAVANRWLDVVHTKGAYLTDAEARSWGAAL